MGDNCLVIDAKQKVVFSALSQLDCESRLEETFGMSLDELDTGFRVLKKHPAAFASYSNGKGLDLELVMRAKFLAENGTSPGQSLAA